jgi:Cu(I)/Ag(I) efflux system membrane fusion protein
MKKINFNKYFSTSWSFVFMILFVTSVSIFVFSSCKQQKKEAVTVANKDVYYTCSMHPQVHEDHPGNCPICGMKLIAVSKKSMNSGTSMQIQLSAEQIRLGNIHVDTIGKENIGEKLVLTGTLNFNQDKLSTVSARVEGRVDRLYFKNIGDYVAKGAILYSLYSEQLNNAKEEYVNALQQQSSLGTSLINYAALVESAKTKLLLWGMTEAQIKELTQGKQAATHTIFYSTESGYITAINANEGEYVLEGGPVIQLANLSTLWAEAQVYTTQMPSINKNENVTVQIPDLNETINGNIDFVNPEINPDTRINLVRVTVPNKNNLLHPGMSVYIILQNKQRNALTLPAAAVLRDSKGASVWVQTKPGIYEIRMVKTGIAENDAVEIISGLNTGEAVVTTGAYLLNSEYIFQHGADPMAGMKM